MKNIIIRSIAVVAAGLLSYSCVDLNLTPVNEMNTGTLEEDPAGIEYTTNGVYQWFWNYRGDPDMPNGDDVRCRYVREWFQMSEFRGDNIYIAGATTDPMQFSYDYRDTPDAETVRYMWYVGYSMLKVLNSNLALGEEGLSLKDDHILGENYFLRAMVYLNMCDLYARPYTHGADNPAVILLTTPEFPEAPVRATIGEVYTQIEADLKKAIALMDQDYRREASAGFAWKGAAQGLLARLYLYMERNQEVVNLVTEMMEGKSAIDMLDPDLATYFTRSASSPETLWCISILAAESPGDEGIASMYFQSPQGVGWGEIYTSDPMYNLFTRYAEDDVRWTGFHQYQAPAAPVPSYQGEVPQWMANWPRDKSTSGYTTYDNDYRYLGEDEGGRFIIFMNQLDNPSDETVFSGSGKIYIQERTVNTYPEYYYVHNGVETKVTITGTTNLRYGYRKIFNTKFSYQDGDPMLSSPPMIRWGELILNRAEAYAKLGNTEAALADVNAIRERAGLSGDQLMTAENMTPRGYATALDVVLDERRLELCYEGFRYKDVFRNKRALDRRFAGSHIWEVVEWNDLRIPHQISGDEMALSPTILPNPGKPGI
jgi:hypothetical protein